MGLAHLWFHYLSRLGVPSFPFICLGSCIISVLTLWSQKTRQKPCEKSRNSQTVNAMGLWYSATEQHSTSLMYTAGKEKLQAKAEPCVPPKAADVTIKLHLKNPTELLHNKVWESCVLWKWAVDRQWFGAIFSWVISGHFTTGVAVAVPLLRGKWLHRQLREGIRHPGLTWQEMSTVLADAIRP